MADKTISALTAATALAGTEILPVVQGGSTKKATIDQVLSPAAGKGINFSANTHAAGMTKELLDWYEEGVWTPSVFFGGANTGMAVTTDGHYTRVGRLLTVRCSVVFTAKGSSTGLFQIAGFPFANSIAGTGAMGFNYGWAIMPTGGITFTATGGVVYAMPANLGGYVDHTYFTDITAINDLTISCMI